MVYRRDSDLSYRCAYKHSYRRDIGEMTPLNIVVSCKLHGAYCRVSGSSLGVFIYIGNLIMCRLLTRQKSFSRTAILSHYLSLIR